MMDYLVQVSLSVFVLSVSWIYCSYYNVLIYIYRI
jgi:hypothetical protein